MSFTSYISGCFFNADKETKTIFDADEDEDLLFT